MEVAGVQVGPQGASRVRPSPGRHQTFTGAKVIPMMGFTARRCQTATSITGDIMHRMSLLYEPGVYRHTLTTMIEWRARLLRIAIWSKMNARICHIPMYNSTMDTGQCR